MSIRRKIGKEEWRVLRFLAERPRQWHEAPGYREARRAAEVLHQRALVGRRDYGGVKYRINKAGREVLAKRKGD